LNRLILFNCVHVKLEKYENMNPKSPSFKCDEVDEVAADWTDEFVADPVDTRGVASLARTSQ